MSQEAKPNKPTTLREKLCSDLLLKITRASVIKMPIMPASDHTCDNPPLKNCTINAAFEIQIIDVTVAAVDDLEKTVNNPNAIVARVSRETNKTIPGSHRLACGPKNRMT
jgi:hypothetical protein